MQCPKCHREVSKVDTMCNSCGFVQPALDDASERFLKECSLYVQVMSGPKPVTP